MTERTTDPTADEAMPDIPLTPVKSNQLAAVGYDPLTKTLAITFARGNGVVYHYPNCEPKLHADLIGAESIGKFFGAHVKALPFKKYAPKADAQAAAAPAPSARVPAWPFPSSAH